MCFDKLRSIDLLLYVSVQGKSIMKLSEYGLMPKLIDFLRVVDDNDTLCITGKSKYIHDKLFRNNVI